MLSHLNPIGILDNRYILLKELGSGFSCIAYKIIDYNSNKDVCIKFFLKNINIYLKLKWNSIKKLIKMKIHLSLNI